MTGVFKSILLFAELIAAPLFLLELPREESNVTELVAVSAE